MWRWSFCLKKTLLRNCVVSHLWQILKIIKFFCHKKASNFFLIYFGFSLSSAFRRPWWWISIPMHRHLTTFIFFNAVFSYGVSDAAAWRNKNKFELSISLSLLRSLAVDAKPSDSFNFSTIKQILTSFIIFYCRRSSSPPYYLPTTIKYLAKVTVLQLLLDSLVFSIDM